MSDFWTGAGVALIIIAVAGAVWIGKDQERLCIREHGTWKNDTCTFREAHTPGR